MQEKTNHCVLPANIGASRKALGSLQTTFFGLFQAILRDDGHEMFRGAWQGGKKHDVSTWLPGFSDGFLDLEVATEKKNGEVAKVG